MKHSYRSPRAKYVNIEPHYELTTDYLGIQDLKLKFHELGIQRALRYADYLDVAKHYHKIWEAPKVQEDPDGLAIKVGCSWASWRFKFTEVSIGHRKYRLLLDPCTVRQ